MNYSNLSDQEIDEIVATIKRGKPLPARFKPSLFENISETELIWPGKSTDIEKIVLPFQSIEQIDEPRSSTEHQFDLFSVDSSSGRQTGGWTNKLIWGDNKLILSSLVNGTMREEIEKAGGLKLVYIDPPFDVGADFSMEVEVGNDSVTKRPSVVEEVAYRDTWGRGKDSYINMIYSRIRLIYSLMAMDSYIVVHVDWHVSHHIRMVLDEVFGPDNFVNEIIWHYYNKYSAAKTAFPRAHDNLFVYKKGNPGNINEVREERDAPVKQLLRENIDGKLRNKRDNQGRLMYQEVTDKKVDDVWRIPALQPASGEWTGYNTQKHHELLERVIEAFSNKDDLVGDFFCGSGTSLVVAERLQRKWVGADLGRFAIHTTRKRLIGVQRKARAEGKPYRAFEILNLGAYERQYFAGIDMTLPVEQQKAISAERRELFLSTIMSAYGAERSDQFMEFHGIKDSASVFVGPIDSAVTQDDVKRCVESARSLGISRIDILGFEFEMGIKPMMVDEAKEQGVTIALRYIPNDVFDTKLISRGEVKFFDVGYIEIDAKQKKNGAVTVDISDFGVFYSQEDAESAAQTLKPGGSKIIVESGQVVRISKDKKGISSKDILTKIWSDWIDYWSVDFDFKSQRELIKEVVDGVEKSVWTGRYIFENQWQEFRTRNNRVLRTTSDEHIYASPGEYNIAVKVVDIFGNDTTKVIKIKVK